MVEDGGRAALFSLSGKEMTMRKLEDARDSAFAAELSWYLDARGKVVKFDPEVLESDRRHGEPKSEKEAAYRHRLMQMAQIIRVHERIYGTLAA